MKKVKCENCKHWDMDNKEKLEKYNVVVAECDCGNGFHQGCSGAECCFFEVEPQVYEVECTFEQLKSGHIIACPGNNFFEDKHLIGKRTKLTIEVLL